MFFSGSMNVHKCSLCVSWILLGTSMSGEYFVNHPFPLNNQVAQPLPGVNYLTQTRFHIKPVFVNRCIGLTWSKLKKGNCASIDPCQPNPCAPDEKWVYAAYNIKHLMTGPEGNSEFCFPRIPMFPETKSEETLRFEENKIHCSPRDQSLRDLLYSKANGSNQWKNNHVIGKWRATAVNISRVTVNCFPFDVTH